MIAATATAPTSIDGILRRLAERLFIMRDKAAKDLARLVDSNELKEADIDVTEKWIVSNAHAAKPELRQGALMAAMALRSWRKHPAFKEQMIDIAKQALRDDESQVRIAVADLLPHLAAGDTALLQAFLSELLSLLPSTPTTDRDGSALDTLFRAFHLLLLSASVPVTFPEVGYTALHAASKFALPFVRQSGLPLIHWICDKTPEEAQAHAQLIADILQHTLLDISPPVRFVAVAAMRPFIDACCRKAPLDELYPQLVPALCLNRYFPAESLGRHCAETWQHAVGTRGRDVIARLMPSVLACYFSEARAPLPACREAACRCLSEMVHKLAPEAVAPHAKDITAGLVLLASDNTWQIRDAALMGLAGALERHKSSIDLAPVIALLRERLADFIWCVREAAATALMQVYATNEPKNVAELCRLIREGLDGFNSQQEESAEAHKGHVHTHKPGDAHPHSDEPWQLTAGALSLFRMLALRSPEAASELVPLVAQIALRQVSFCQRAQFLETLWAEVGAVAIVLASALAPYWTSLITALVRDVGVSAHVRRAASKTAAVLKEVAKDAVATLPAETQSAFNNL